jgi:lipooligosaccharide transport system permease protein
MTMSTLALRVVPAPLVRRRRALRLVERNVYVYRRTWMILLSGFFEPLFYLWSMKVGIGALVGTVTSGGRPIRYLDFVAPALLASSAMNGAVYDSTMNVYFKLKYAKTYDAVLTTPVGVGDVALGEIAWALIRGALYAVAFQIVMLAMGLAHSWWSVLVVPSALLIGFGFAAIGLTATSYMRSWQDFVYVTLTTLPLFLFSATFYPLSTYGSALQWIVRVTPLYQGVTMVRDLSLGTVGWSTLGHAVYLFAMGLVGVRWSSRRLGRLLLQ